MQHISSTFHFLATLILHPRLYRESPYFNYYGLSNDHVDEKLPVKPSADIEEHRKRVKCKSCAGLDVNCRLGRERGIVETLTVAHIEHEQTENNSMH